MINSPQPQVQQPQVQQNRRPAFAPSYNAVQINLDTPTLNAPPMPGYYYDYPQADGQPYYPPVQTNPQTQPVAPAQPNVPPPAVETKPTETAPAPTGPNGPNPPDINKVIANLSDPDLDKRAIQMEEITRKGLNNEADVVPYVQQDVFEKLIDIVNEDSTKLAGPTDRQVELRAKLMENNAVAQQAQAEGKDPNSVKLPHQMTREEIEFADTLTPLEQSERNKEYALYTMAVLQKTYGDEIEKQTGNVVPLTDLPGAAQLVNELKENPNFSVRTAAIDSLRTLKRPEYKEDLTRIFTIAQSDAEDRVVAAATDALNELNK